MYKEKLETIIQAIGSQWGREDEDAFGIIEKALSSFGDYVLSVYRMESRMIVLKTLRPESFCVEVERLDKARQAAHEAAISICTAMNRMAKALNVEPMCPETDDRRIIGEFCFNVVEEFFHRGRNNDKSIPKQEINDFVESLKG